MSFDSFLAIAENSLFLEENLMMDGGRDISFWTQIREYVVITCFFLIIL